MQRMLAFQLGIKEKSTLEMGLWIFVDDLPSRSRPEAGGHPGLSTVSPETWRFRVCCFLANFQNLNASKPAEGCCMSHVAAILHNLFNSDTLTFTLSCQECTRKKVRGGVQSASIFMRVD